MVDSRDTYEIPLNQTGGINIGNYSIKTTDAVIAVIFAVVFLFIAYGIVYLFDIDIFSTTSITIYLIAIGLGGFVGFNGIKGENIPHYVFNMIMFYRKKRVAFYNPNLKKMKTYEATVTDDTSELLPRDKLIALFEKTKLELTEKGLLSESYYDELNSYEIDTSTLIFEDDETEESERKGKKRVKTKR